MGTQNQAIEYRHNALGQRVEKLVNGQVVEQYLWQDLITLLAVYDGNGNLKQRFEHTVGHSPTSFTQNGGRYYIQTDHLGSPRVITDSNGSVVRSIRYDSYGNITHDSDPEFAIPFGFAGGLYDTDTGLIRFGYRDYDPQAGRWTARDPIGFGGGDTNLYGYVLGDPINLIDPYGLFDLPALPQWLVDGAAGFGDGISGGLTNRFRDYMGTNAVVNQNSAVYGGWELAGTVTGIAGGAGGVGAGSRGAGAFFGGLDLASTAADINYDCDNTAGWVDLGGLATQELITRRLDFSGTVDVRAAAATANGLMGSGRAFINANIGN